MAIKRILFIFFAATLTFNTYAITRKQKVYFKQAKKSYKARDYRRTISLINKVFRLKSTKTPSGALTLVAWSLEKLGHYKKANILLKRVTDYHYKKYHIRVLRKYKRDGGSDDLPRIPIALAAIYHRRAESISRIYVRDYNKLSKRARATYKKFALTLVDIASVHDDYEDESLEEVSARFEEYDTLIAKSKFEWSYFASIAYLSWRDVLVLRRNSNNNDIDLKTTTEGMCLGGGVAYQNAFWLFHGSGCLASAAAIVGTEGSSTTSYFEKDVPVTAFLFSLGGLYKPASKDVAIGLNIPIMSRSGDYTQPDGFTLENTSLVSVGYLVEAQWKLSQVDIVTKLGKFTGLSSSMIQIQINYNF